MKARIAQSFTGKLVDIRRRHAATERAELSKACVIQQNQHDVWRALGRAHYLWKRGRIRLLVGAADFAREMEIGTRQRRRRRSARSLSESRICEHQQDKSSDKTD